MMPRVVILSFEGSDNLLDLVLSLHRIGKCEETAAVVLEEAGGQGGYAPVRIRVFGKICVFHNFKIS